MLELASHIVETKSGHFEPDKFEDQYEDALKELRKRKQADEKIETPRACASESHQSAGLAFRFGGWPPRKSRA
jgi:non-homologous end joining protein Ku